MDHRLILTLPILLLLLGAPSFCQKADSPKLSEEQIKSMLAAKGDMNMAERNLAQAQLDLKAAQDEFIKVSGSLAATCGVTPDGKPDVVQAPRPVYLKCSKDK